MSTPVAEHLDSVAQALTEAAELPLFACSEADLDQILVHAAAVRAQLDQLTLRTAAQLAVTVPDTRTRWAVETRQTKRATAARLRLGQALERHPVLAAAMSRGEVSEEQAGVIVHALDALPVGLDPYVVELAEKQLVADAHDFDPDALRRLGRRVLDHVAPEIGEDHERRALEREERTAARECWLTLRDDGHGRTRLAGLLPASAGAMLRKDLLALTMAGRDRPGFEARSVRTSTDGPGSATALGSAFCELLERYPTDRLPHAGGVNASVVVTMTLADLLGSTDKPALLDTGTPISPGTARRLACEAGIIPAVLGGASQPLDVGRLKRFHTPAQRHAIGIRDKTCTAEGCDYPPWLCHVHHDTPRSKGGHTNVQTGRLLCTKHHRMAHDPRYEMRKTKNGRVVFVRP